MCFYCLLGFVYSMWTVNSARGEEKSYLKGNKQYLGQDNLKVRQSNVIGLTSMLDLKELYSFLATVQICACVGIIEIILGKLTAFCTCVKNCYKNKPVSGKPCFVLVKDTIDLQDEKPQNKIVDDTTEPITLH